MCNLEQPDSYAGPLLLSNCKDILIDKLEVIGEVKPIGSADPALQATIGSVSSVQIGGLKNIAIRNSKNIGTIYVQAPTVSGRATIENITLENNENIGLSCANPNALAGYVIVKGCNKMYHDTDIKNAAIADYTYKISTLKPTASNYSIENSWAYENDATKANDTANYTTYEYAIPAIYSYGNESLQSAIIEGSIFSVVVLDASINGNAADAQSRVGSFGMIRNVKLFLNGFWTFGFESVVIENVTQRVLNYANSETYPDRRGLRLSSYATRRLEMNGLIAIPTPNPADVPNHNPIAGWAAVIYGINKFDYARIINSTSDVSNQIIFHLGSINQLVPSYYFGIRNEDGVIVSDSIPTLGNEWKVNDKIYNTFNVAQDKLGWRCIQAAIGTTPAVWASFGVV